MARALGCRLDEVPIAGPRAAVMEALAPLFAGPGRRTSTEENVQSRLRGLLLMALSNKFGEMLLTTGNKCEMAVGYATIYGDMAGGYNPIKDLYKMRVFDACRWRNANHRPWMKGPDGRGDPAARHRQAALGRAARQPEGRGQAAALSGARRHPGAAGREATGRSPRCVEAGFERDTVKKVERLVYLAEYKRLQSAPGTRLTNKAFWLDRRYPMVMRWRDPS